MRIFVSAAEISSDLQAEKILRALIENHPHQKFEVYGIGGPALRALPGFRALAHAESMRAMGFAEVLSKIPALKRIQREVIQDLDRQPPDVILTFDYPDFHFSLMKRIEGRSWFRGTLRICGIPPKVWVWRAGRVETIRRLYSGVWVIFPFEEAFYRDRGIPAIYAGNPLIAELGLPKTPPTTEDEVRIAVLPGSRDGELGAHLKLIGPTLNELAHLTGKAIHAEVPVPEGVDAERIERELISTERVHYRVIRGGSYEVLSSNSIGLIKSGTATLEAAVLGCVPVIFYRMSRLSEWIFKRWVRYAGPVGLPNILLGVRNRARSVFPELLGSEARPDLLATTLFRLIDQPAELEVLRKKGEELRKILVPDPEVPSKIAERFLEWIQHPPTQAPVRKKKAWIACGSFLWSSLNRLRRAFGWLMGRSARMLPVRSILVGNLQAGGAGKTPFVIELAREALTRGYQVGVISRGYGAEGFGPFRWVEIGDSARQVGDEPAEIKAALPEARVILSKDRHEGARELLKQGVDLIIADDGFQNLKFKTDLTVLLVTDAGRDEILYRDFDSEAKGADFLVQAKGPRNPRFGNARKLDWQVEASIQESTRRPLWLWTAIADPTELVSFYEARGIRLKTVITERDHSVPDPGVIRSLIEAARKEGARLAVTPKDAVKLDPDLRSQCLVLRRKLVAESLFQEIFERLQ